MPLLIEKALIDAGIEFTRTKKQPTLITEFSGIQTATSPLFVTANAVIYWKSAYDLGKHHKTKELSGRGLSLKYQFSNGRFSERWSSKKLILVLDGTFENEQLAVLLNSGWDSIFYPDEMNALVTEIS